MKKILLFLFLLSTALVTAQFVKVGGGGTNALLDNGTTGSTPLPAPYVVTNSTNARINGELNIGIYNPLKISMGGAVSANPNYAAYTAPGASGGGGWSSGHRFYTAWGSTLFSALTVESISASNALSSFTGNVSVSGSLTSIGVLTSAGVLTPSTAPYIVRSINGNANSPFEITNTYNAESNYDTAINFNLISTAGGGYANAFIFRLRPNNSGINTTVEILRLDHSMTAPSVTINAPTTISSTLKTTGYLLSALNTAPSSATDTGTLGEIRITADYVYVCTATNTWVRTALATW